MNPLHVALISDLRQELSQLTLKTSIATLLDMDDAQMAKMLFVSMRGRGKASRGLRLSALGAAVLSTVYVATRVNIKNATPDSPLTARTLLFLDRTATMPYFISNREIVVFEDHLAVLLKLSDGDLDWLAE